MDKNEAWDKLLELGVSEQTLQIVTSINGFSMDTMNDILFAHTSLRSFGQVQDDFEQAEDEED